MPDHRIREQRFYESCLFQLLYTRRGKRRCIILCRYELFSRFAHAARRVEKAVFKSTQGKLFPSSAAACFSEYTSFHHPETREPPHDVVTRDASDDCLDVLVSTAHQNLISDTFENVNKMPLSSSTPRHALLTISMIDRMNSTP